MSKQIDERVVSMQFDNSRFEKNVQTSMSTLDKLKEKLNLKGASKGLEEVDAAAKKVDMTPLSNAAETVKVKFSALEVMAVTALTNITNSAVNTGKQLVKSLSIDQITAGWGKFSSKTTSVSTLVAQGNELDTVNEQLDKLNWFTDETSYNFTDMVENISKFTATGKGLEESVTAMEGIANWAALSGQNANTASRAMYQISQAMGAGVMRLEDYKSIQNASMDTDEFRQKCLDAAVAAGTLKKNAKGMYQSVNGGDAFNKSQFTTQLTEGAWLTSDVMMSVFNDYSEAVNAIYKVTEDKGMLASEVLDEIHDRADELKTGTMTDEEAIDAAIKDLGYTLEDGSLMFDSFGVKAFEAAQKARTWGDAVDSVKDAVSTGWMNTFEIIFGNAEEATELFTDLANAMYDVFAGGAEARNELLQGWKDLGGRDALIEAFWNVWDAISSIVTPIKEAFREIFPAKTAEQLYKISEKIRDFTAKLKLSDEQSAKLKSTFKGLFSIIKIGVTVVKAIVGGVASLIGKLTGLGGGILGVTGSLGDWISGVAKSVTKTNIFAKAINKLVEFLGKVIDKFKEFGSAVKSKFEAPGFETFLNILNTIWSGIKKVGLAVVGVASQIGKALGNALRNGDAKSLLDLVNGGIVTAILLKLKSWVSGFKDLAGEGKGFIQSIKDTFGALQDSLGALQQKVKADTLKKIAISIAILAASLWVVASIDQDKLGSALAAMAGLFIELMSAMKAFDKLGNSFKGAGKTALLMIGMALAVLILASAMKKLSDLNWNEIVKGLSGVAGLIGSLTGAMIALSKFASTSESVFSISKKGLFSSKSKTQFVSIALAMIAMAAAVKILASACADLGSMSWNEIAKGLTGVIGMMGAMTGAMIALSKFAGSTKKLEVTSKGIFSSKNKNNFISIGIAMIAMAAAMKILASAAKDFADMSWEGLGKAGAAITVILGLVVGFNKLCDYVKGDMTKPAWSLILMGAAMEIFADVANKFAGMSWEGLGKAGAAIAAILGLAVGFVKLSDYSKYMPESVGCLIVMGIAMEIFADVCKKFGQMDWSALAKAGVAIAGILGLTVAFAIISNNAEHIMYAAFALLVMANALLIFTPVLVVLGSMSWESIAKGLIALAGGLAIFIGAAAIIEKAGLIGAMYALSGAIALFGVGCALAGVGVAAFAVGLGILAGITATGATAIVAALHIIVVGILELIPAMIGALTDAVVALCQVFIQCVPAIGEAIRVFILEIIKIFVECIPQLADGLLKTVVGVLEALVQYTPQIIDLVFDFLIAILEGIAKRLPELIQAVVNVFKALFSGVIDALNSMDPEMLLKGILGIGFMWTMMAALASMAAMAGPAMVGVLGFGAVITELAGVLAVLGGLAQIPGLEWLISEGGNFLQTVGTAIGKFIGGIVGGIAEGVTSTLPQVGTNLSDFMTNIQPFIEGAKAIDPTSLEGVESLVGIILALTRANILDSLTSWFTGGSSLTKFGEEIAAFAPSMKEYADTVKDIDPETVTASANAAQALSELAAGLPNSGGIAGFFAGENDMDVFAEQLPKLGAGLLAFSMASAGINPENVTAAASAAKSIAEMADTIPNQGGVVAWFAGDNSIASFGAQLPILGAGLLAFSLEVSGINPENVTAAASAAKSIAEMADTIPNEGGVAAWFSGDNGVASFALQLPILGAGLLAFSLEVSGINPENVIAAANAAKALAEMADTIPNEGGIKSWFAGDNSVASFGAQLPILGAGLLGFSMSLDGIVPENIIAAANAAKALAEMANTIPNTGGIKSWFAGDNSVASFAAQLPILGAGLLGFSMSLDGIVPENITSAANAAKSLAEMLSIIPSQDGITAWYSVALFAEQLPILGAGLLAFSTAATGVNAEVVASAVSAAKNIAELTTVIPNEGGIQSWLNGESGLAKFANNLPLLGAGLLGFSLFATGINAEAVAAATSAAKSLAELTNTIPNEGGIQSWFSGESGLAKFANNLPTLGEGLSEFSTAVEGITPENVTAAAEAAKKLGEMTSVLPKNVDRIESFGNKIKTFGTKLSEYFTETGKITAESITASNNATKAITDFASKVNPSTIDSASKAIEELVNALQKAGKVKENSVDGFSKALKKVAENNADAIIKAFKDQHSKIESAGKTLMDKFIDGVEAKEEAVETAAKGLAEDAADAISDKESSFKTAGEDCAKGFANGLKSKSILNSVIDAASSLGKAALKAAKEALDENSPSKEMYQVGDYAGIGFVNALYDNISQAYKAGAKVADSAKDGISKSVSRIADIINSDIDAQPTIRPVLDLSDVRAGAGSINALFSGRTLAVDTSGVGVISASMSKRQNGNSELASAINKLAKTNSSKTGDTYTINGINYSEGSDVSDAIKTLVRATKMDGRT